MGVFVCISSIGAEGLCQELPFWEGFPVADKVNIYVVEGGCWVSVVDGGHGRFGVLVEGGPYVRLDVA